MAGLSIKHKPVYIEFNIYYMVSVYHVRIQHHTSCTAQSRMFLTASSAALFGAAPVKSPITDTATAL